MGFSLIPRIGDDTHYVILHRICNGIEAGGLTLVALALSTSTVIALMTAIQRMNCLMPKRLAYSVAMLARRMRNVYVDMLVALMPHHMQAHMTANDAKLAP